MGRAFYTIAMFNYEYPVGPVTGKGIQLGCGAACKEQNLSKSWIQNESDVSVQVSSGYPIKN